MYSLQCFVFALKYVMMKIWDLLKKEQELQIVFEIKGIFNEKVLCNNNEHEMRLYFIDSIRWRYNFRTLRTKKCFCQDIWFQSNQFSFLKCLGFIYSWNEEITDFGIFNNVNYSLVLLSL